MWKLIFLINANEFKSWWVFFFSGTVDTHENTLLARNQHWLASMANVWAWTCVCYAWGGELVDIKANMESVRIFYKRFYNRFNPHSSNLCISCLSILTSIHDGLMTIFIRFTLLVDSSHTRSERGPVCAISQICCWICQRFRTGQMCQLDVGPDSDQTNIYIENVCRKSRNSNMVRTSSKRDTVWHWDKLMNLCVQSAWICWLLLTHFVLVGEQVRCSATFHLFCSCVLLWHQHILSLASLFCQNTCQPSIFNYGLMDENYFTLIVI